MNIFCASPWIFNARAAFGTAVATELRYQISVQPLYWPDPGKKRCDGKKIKTNNKLKQDTISTSPTIASGGKKEAKEEHGTGGVMKLYFSF